MAATAKRRTTKPVERKGVAFRLPGDLIADIDVIAAQENRSRAKQVEVLLRQGVQAYRQRSAA